MEYVQNKLYTAFAGNARVVTGNLQEVAIAVKECIDAGNLEPMRVFDHDSSAPVDLDVHGTRAEVSILYGQKPDNPQPPVARGRGRPKLGVVGREVTLLPRHWEWLQAQRGGASVALRKLVGQARKDNKEVDELPQARNSVHSFMNAIAGNLAGFEEACRALFAADQRRFNFEIELWPDDIRAHVKHLSPGAFAE